jgi:hypothetical protein
MKLPTKTPIRGCHPTFNKSTSVEPTPNQPPTQELDDDPIMPALLDPHIYSDDDSSSDDSAPMENPSRDYHSDSDTNLPITPMFNIFIPTINNTETANLHRNSQANEYCGTPMPLPKPDNVTRFYSGNVNGIKYTKTGNPMRDHSEEQHHMEADVRGYIEHNLDTMNFQVREMFHKTAKLANPHYVLTMASSTIPAATTYKPGGTASIAMGDITGRLSEHGSDDLGRWSFMKFQGRSGRVVTHITAYQVCVRPTNKTGFTAFHQQEVLLRRKQRTDTNPRKNFHSDLKRFIQGCQLRNEDIYLAGDFNETLEHSNSRMRSLCAECNLVDIWTHLHPEHPDFATYIRGSTRIDYCLVSLPLVSAIRSIGYEPFHFRSKTDHRGLYVDFNTDLLFGNETHRLANTPLRGINSKDIKSCETFIEASYSHCSENNLFTNLSTLIQSGHRDDNAIEIFDQLIGAAGAHAEKQCKKKRRPWWSQELHEHRQWMSMLRRMESGFTNGFNLTQAVTARMQEHGFVQDVPQTIYECRAKIRDATSTLHEILTKARSHRETEQTARAELYDESGRKSQARIQTEMKHKERAAAMFRTFKAIRGQTTDSRGITQLEVPTSWPAAGTPIESIGTLPDPKKSSDWRLITLPEEIVYYLLLRNRFHFGQAEGTPFTTAPFRHEIDWEASSATAEMILEGTWTNDELDDVMQLLMSHCKKVTALDTQPDFITVAEFESKFKIWNERTTTSPSGRHLGYYKAIVKQKWKDSEDPDDVELESKRTALVQAHVHLINYALSHGYALQRWKTVVNIMIFKEPGNHKIHRLRVIHLYEADYNFILGTQWRKLLQQADRAGTIHPGQHGGRPGHEATTLTFMEELKTDIAYSSLKHLINFDNDAASCYDRIIPALAALIGRKYGHHRRVIVVNAKTLKEARFHLKTALGISEEFYSHCDAYPIYGTGQGSGNSPVIWCFVSSTLFDCHQDQAHGAIFESPDRSESLRITMVGFVDDSTGQVNDFLQDQQPDPKILLERMTHDAQLWSDLLWLSGGLLELSKCSYHFLYFDFQPDGTAVPRAGQVGPALTVQDSQSQTPVSIPSKSVYCAHKTLGHYKAPAGNCMTQRIALNNKANRLSQQLATGPIHRDAAWTFYHSIYLPSIRYVLPQNFFSQDLLSQLEAKPMGAIFAKCGYNRKTNQKVLYGPRSLGGQGFIRWYTLQGEGQIQLFIKFWRTQSQASTLLRVALAWVQYQSGRSLPILTDVHTTLPYLTARWIPALRTFLATIDGQIELDRNYIPALQRHGDEHIMDKVVDSGAFTTLQLQQINRCRLYLDVSTVSDLTTANGKFIDTAILQGHRTILSSVSRWHKTNQARPSAESWTQWTRVCRIWSRRNGSLFSPLTLWLVPGSQLRRSWPCYFDYRRKFLYIRKDQCFLQLVLYDGSFLEGIEVQWNPNDYCYPVEAVPCANTCWQVIHPIHPIIDSEPPFIPETFPELINTLDPWEQEMLST